MLQVWDEKGMSWTANYVFVFDDGIPKEFLNGLKLDLNDIMVNNALSYLNRCRGVEIKNLRLGGEFRLYTYLENSRWIRDILRIDSKEVNTRLAVDYPLLFHYMLLTLIIFDKAKDKAKIENYRHLLEFILFLVINGSVFKGSVGLEQLMVELPYQFPLSHINSDLREVIDLREINYELVIQLGKFSQNAVLYDLDENYIIASCENLDQIKHILN